MTIENPDRRSSCAWTVSLIAAVPLYLLSMLMVGDIGRGDPATRGLGSGFAFLFQLVMWLPLGAFVALSCARGGISGPRLAAVAAALVLAAVASLWGIIEMSRPDWAVAAPALLPLLAVLFGLWARMQASEGTRSRPVLIGFAAVAAALMAVPVAHYLIWNPIREREQAELERAFAEDQRRQAAAEQAKEARFQRLGAHSRLDDYLPFLDVIEPRYQEAVAGARRLPSRQADAERLLASAAPLDQLETLHELDLQATPALCLGYRTRLAGSAAGITSANPEWGSVLSVVRDHIPNFRWFVTRGCDLRTETRRIRELATPLAPQYGWEDLLTELDRLLTTRPG